MLDIFDPLFEPRDNRLKKLGNPLLELEHTIDWESFRSVLDQSIKKNAKAMQEHLQKMW